MTRTDDPRPRAGTTLHDGRAAGIDAAVATLCSGGMVIVVDDQDRENEGDLVAAAATITAEQVAFMVRYSTGILCAPMTAERAEELRLPQMVEDNTDAHGTAFTVTVDHVDAGTGVSAPARAMTLRALADESTAAETFRRPGHVFPLRARAGGVLTRPGHTEAAVDLLRLAGLPQIGVIAELVADDGEMLHGEGLREFATAHRLPMIHIADLVHRLTVSADSVVEEMSSAMMPTAFGEFTARAFRGDDGVEHLALVCGDVSDAAQSSEGVLARVHSECLTGDILGSLRCDCGAQLEQALRAVSEAGAGVVVYLRGHEGRGIGLGNKIQAYALQEQGYDTVDANIVQGLPADDRDYAAGAAILAAVGARRVQLISNNQEKVVALEKGGIEVVHRISMPPCLTPHNVRYLQVKRDRMGHVFGSLGAEARRSG